MTLKIKNFIKPSLIKLFFAFSIWDLFYVPLFDNLILKYHPLAYMDLVGADIRIFLLVILLSTFLSYFVSCILTWYLASHELYKFSITKIFFALFLFVVSSAVSFPWMSRMITPWHTLPQGCEMTVFGFPLSGSLEQTYCSQYSYGIEDTFLFAVDIFIWYLVVCLFIFASKKYKLFRK